MDVGLAQSYMYTLDQIFRKKKRERKGKERKEREGIRTRWGDAIVCHRVVQCVHTKTDLTLTEYCRAAKVASLPYET